MLGHSHYLAVQTAERDVASLNIAITLPVATALSGGDGRCPASRNVATVIGAACPTTPNQGEHPACLRGLATSRAATWESVASAIDHVVADLHNQLRPPPATPVRYHLARSRA